MNSRSHVLLLAIAQFRRDWPFMSVCPASLRDKAALRGPACGDTASAAGAQFSALPDGNHGDNQTSGTDKAAS